jgi:glutaminyl-peptide cyclotransferase
MAAQFESIRDNKEVSIMLIFFDGEEAFLQWSPIDSIYGARHLAAKWEEEKFLHRIDVFVLLDLLGAPDPTFYSLNQESGGWYSRLRETEDRLSHRNLLKRYTSSGIASHGPNTMFNQLSVQAGIEDDHLPFMRRNVPILHLIPVPFPEVWHKIQDDRKAIDLATVENLLKILRIFVIEYLHIEMN